MYHLDEHYAAGNVRYVTTVHEFGAYVDLPETKRFGRKYDCFFGWVMNVDAAVLISSKNVEMMRLMRRIERRSLSDGIELNSGEPRIEESG